MDGLDLCAASLRAEEVMRGESLGRVEIEPAFVGVQPRLVRDILSNDLLDRCLIGNRDMEGADVAAALHKGNDRALVRGTTLAALGERAPACRLAANLGLIDRAVIGLIGLNDLAFAAQRAKVASPHGFADAVAHEPSRLVIEA